MPDQCSFCNVKGHTDSACPKRRRYQRAYDAHVDDTSSLSQHGTCTPTARSAALPGGDSSIQLQHNTPARLVCIRVYVSHAMCASIQNASSIHMSICMSIHTSVDTSTCTHVFTHCYSIGACTRLYIRLCMHACAHLYASSRTRLYMCMRARVMDCRI